MDFREGESVQWEADVEAEALEHLDVEIASVSAGFQGQGAVARGRIDLQDTRYQHLSWPRAEASVEYEQSLSVRLGMEDENQGPWTAVLRQSGDEVTLSEFMVSLDDESWSLKEPVEMLLSPERQEVPRLAVQSSSGKQIALAFRRSHQELLFEVETSEFPLSVLDTVRGESGHSGQVSANVRMEKQGHLPVLVGRVSGRKMLIPGHLQGARMDVEFTPKAEGQGLEFSLGRGKKTLATVEAVLPLGGGVGGLDWSAPVSAELLLMPSDNRVFRNVVPGLPELPKGWTASQLSISGTLLKPSIDAETGFEWMLLEGPEFFRG
ncbi:MAG: hypothetical protein VYB14_04645, partial [Planctomycetota bacterium]|nr:hypothetical protein [Planctomycetota bacterium]